MRRPQSYSSIATYKKCPKLWQDQYVFGNRTPPGAAAARGTELHARLEEFFSGGAYPSAVKALAPWQRFMEALTVHNPKPERKYARDASWVECGFDDPECYVRGAGDLTYQVGNTIHILDWKSGKVYPDHEGQGKMYMAMEDEAPSYRTEFVYLDIPTHTIARDYSASDRVIEVAKLINVVEIVNADEDYKPTPSVNSCQWCHLSWRRGGTCRAAP